jgi:DNA mismatch repair protein MutL
MGSILTLPQTVYTRIAAGEVIEGPFSVVRELIDNALDAGCGQVRVEIRNGGRDLIQVTDDGSGMSGEDAALAVLKHTTSKIQSIDDIGAIQSLGFRGEALSSICAVSEFTMVTALSANTGPSNETSVNSDEGSAAGSADSETGRSMSGTNSGDTDTALKPLHGTRVTCSGGGEPRIEPCAANSGTRIMVQNLFFNLPARKKFLKSSRSEAARVKDEVLKKALGFPECGFDYRTDGRMVLSLVPVSSCLERISRIFGDPVAAGLIPFETREQEFLIFGFVSSGRHTLPNRGGQYLFVNRRPVADRTLSHAVNSGCRGLLQTGRFPYAFVYIQLDPAMVDVNVHPAKREIKLRLTDPLYSALRRGVEKALQKKLYPLGDPGSSLNGGGPQPPGTDWDMVRQEELHPPYAAAVSRGSAVSGAAGQSEDTPASPHDLTAVPSPDGIVFRGPLFGTYLLFEQTESIILMDQHAAHERVLYEQYRNQAEGTPVKPLMIPINFTPPRARYQEVLDSIPVLGKAGIHLEPFGEESFNITAVPAFIPDRREEEVLTLFLEQYKGGGDETELRDSFTKLAACRNAVKEGDRVSDMEAMSLYRDLLEASVPDRCPHGRPAIVRFSKEYFEKLFGRR